MKNIGVTGLFLLVMALVWSACGSGSDAGANDYADSALYIPRTDLATMNELKTSTGKTWRVHQTPMLDSSLVGIVVEAVGFSKDSLSIDFGEVDPVVALSTEDLDRDGYQELYIVTQSTGPEASGTIYGLYAEMDTSVTVITYEGPNPYMTKEGEPFYGYAGHDQFRFDKGVLTNTFLVHKSETSSETTSRTITFELVKTQGVVSLTPARKK